MVQNLKRIFLEEPANCIKPYLYQICLYFFCWKKHVMQNLKQDQEEHSFARKEMLCK